MILEAIFIQLRRGKPKEFFASLVLSFYGDSFIKKPSIEDLPKEAGDEVNQRILDTWFKHQEDRLPEKRLHNWEVGQLKAAQIRDEEQFPVSKAAVIVPTILCTLLWAMAGLAHKSESWRAERKAKAAVEEAREYAGKRDVLMKQWAAEIAGYSAKKCMNEVSDLRQRKTDEQRDHYAALETGCASHKEEIVAIAKAWSLDDCADYGVNANKTLADGGQTTWVDQVVFRDVCFPKYGQALEARLK